MELFTEVMQRSLPSFLLGGLNALLLWCMWSFRKIFVRHEECAVCRADLQAFEQRFDKQANLSEKLVQRIEHVPTAEAVHGLRLEMAQLRGEQACIATDIKSLRAILKRIEQPLAMLLQHHLKT